MSTPVKLGITVLVLVGTAVLVLLGSWLSVLASRQPLRHPLALLVPWPIACSSRGCITTQAWQQQINLSRAFAAATSSNEPTAEASLTTTIRRHLVGHAFLRSPVTIADARRYREDILNMQEESQVRDALGISLDQYDWFVILPFLQQEALRAQHKVETIDELYGQLSQERWLMLLLFRFGWDSRTGKVDIR